MTLGCDGNFLLHFLTSKLFALSIVSFDRQVKLDSGEEILQSQEMRTNEWEKEQKMSWLKTFKQKEDSMSTVRAFFSWTKSSSLGKTLSTVKLMDQIKLQSNTSSSSPSSSCAAHFIQRQFFVLKTYLLIIPLFPDKICSPCIECNNVFDNMIAKPRVSLTVPNRDHFAQVSLMVLDNFFGCNRQS